MNTAKHTPTPGGNRLRALRDYYGKTQLAIELDASLGIGYLQRLESGKVQQPERDTLERILTALAARYSERRDVLELFGYLVDAPIPDADDMRWAIDVCHAELESAVFPAYLLDCANRLLTWNRFIPRLFQVDAAAFARHEMQPLSMLRVVFDTAYPLRLNVTNQDVFFPAQIRALRYEMQWFHEEAWYARLIEDMLRYPTFKRYWAMNEAEEPQLPARPLTPLQLDMGEEGIWQFRLIAEPFGQDRRFRLVYYLPADPETMRRCSLWQTDAAPRP